MRTRGRVDCHAHIIDPARYPFAAGPGYKPRPDEIGTADTFVAELDAHQVSHALLVQPSCYGYDNAALLAAMEAHPGRFKAIAVVDPLLADRDLAGLAERGVAGTRFNLVSYERDALDRPEASRLLARLRELGWFAQVLAHDDQWPRLAPLLRRSGVKVLIDHFGVRDLSAGPDQPGFRAVLELGREGLASVKLSSPFRLSRQGDCAEVAPFAEALVRAFGVEQCLWGSDWPFIDLPGRFEYGAALRLLERWLPDPADRARVLWANPARLFGFARGVP